MTATQIEREICLGQRANQPLNAAFRQKEKKKQILSPRHYKSSIPLPCPHFHGTIKSAPRVSSTKPLAL